MYFFVFYVIVNMFVEICVKYTLSVIFVRLYVEGSLAQTKINKYIYAYIYINTYIQTDRGRTKETTMFTYYLKFQ